MDSLHIAFSGYAIIGLTVLILSASVAFYLLRLPEKSRATWSLIGFFLVVALSGGSTILSNGLIFWDSLFKPWQDFWILTGGAALGQFAYCLPRCERSREARMAQIALSILALAALVYSSVYSYRFLTQWSPSLDVIDAYYLLLPLGTLLVVILFLRRSMQFSERADLRMGGSSGGHVWRRLLHPQGEEARTFRNFALALSLAFLPGLQTLVGLPGPYGFLLSNIGSILAIIAIALVYFNYAPEVNSFMAKLVGITLATVLLTLAIFGAVDVQLASSDLQIHRMSSLASIHAALTRRGSVAPDVHEIAYVVAWDAVDPGEASRYQELYLSAEDYGFELDYLVDENRQGNVEAVSLPMESLLVRATNSDWRRVWRDGNGPFGRIEASFDSYAFVSEGIVYEIGFSIVSIANHVSAIVSKWLLLILSSSVVVLLVYPLFFRRTLLRPLEALLDGITRVNRGNLDTFVPIRFQDEIGTLTDSFNKLTYSLKESQAQHGQLFQRLQASYDELEERVNDRTRELSAFTDLTMSPGVHASLADILLPVLERIVSIELCDAVCVHLLAEDGKAMDLVAECNLPERVVTAVSTIAPPPVPAGPAHLAAHPFPSHQNGTPARLPHQLELPDFQSHLGMPLETGDNLHGWLSCYRRSEDDFTSGEISLLVALARQMGVVVENQRLRQRIKDVAAYEERQRLARDLHDSVTQLVYSMTLFTRSSQEALEDNDPERLRDNLKHMADTALQTLREMRFLLFELQPPTLEPGGLAKTLDARLAMVEHRVGISVRSQIDDPLPVSAMIERELYYVAIEALNNTLKHANADTVSLTVEGTDDGINLCIEDNGRGFDLARISGGLGIGNMRQRIESLGGDLRIESVINGGTRVIVTVPIGH